MKKIFIVSIIALLMIQASPSIYSQDDELSRLGFEEMPIKDETPPYFGIGIGLVGNLLFMNFDDLNNHIAGTGFDIEGQFKSPFLVFGGEFITIPIIIPNTRVSFFWMGALSRLKNDELFRTLDYSIGMSGLSFDYMFVPFKSFAIAAGVSAGWGEIQIDLFQGENANWDDVKFTPNANSFLNRAETGFIFVQPHLNFEYAMTDYFVVRFGAMYNMTFRGALWTDDWTFNQSAKLTGVPDAVGKAQGLNIQIGLFIGLFNY